MKKEDYFNKLIGCRLSIHYVHLMNLIGLSFIDDSPENCARRYLMNEKGEYNEPYYLHIVCGVRFIDKGTVVVCSDDMYISCDGEDEKTLFDKNIEDFLDKHWQDKIIDIQTYEYGDIVLRFNTGMFIHVYSNTTTKDDELWRLSIGETVPHLICSLEGYEYSRDIPEGYKYSN